MNGITEAVTSIAVAIVGVAIVAVIVSRRSDTANVLRSAGQAFSGALGVAVSPVTGNSPGGFSPMSFVPSIGGV